MKIQNKPFEPIVTREESAKFYCLDCGGTYSRHKNTRQCKCKVYRSADTIGSGKSGVFCARTLALGILSLLLFNACAQTPVVAPSTKPLQSDLSHAQANITQAKTLAQRIHDKDVIIDMWNKQHQSQ